MNQNECSTIPLIAAMMFRLIAVAAVAVTWSIECVVIAGV